eukprot:1161981-Pelagomonas_calceolata.AAC.9
MAAQGKCFCPSRSMATQGHPSIFAQTIVHSGHKKQNATFLTHNGNKKQILSFLTGRRVQWSHKGNPLTYGLSSTMVTQGNALTPHRSSCTMVTQDKWAARSPVSRTRPTLAASALMGACL